MRYTAEPGEVEKNWAEAIEDLGVPAKLWDEVIANSFVLPPGRKLPNAFMLLMRDWVQDSAERYDYVRPYGISDQDYVYSLLTQAHHDANQESGDFLWGHAETTEHPWQKAIEAFYQGNIPGRWN